MTDTDTSHDHDDDAGEGRYSTIDLEDGGLIVYDQQNPKAWIQVRGSDSVWEVRE